jgi:hypothetical protein
VSKADKKHHWRNVRCEGCALRCKYRDFRPFAGENVLEVVHEWLYKDTDDPEQWVQKSRGVLLGKAHQHKKDLWNQWTNKCPNWGAESPVEPDLFDSVPF